MDLAQNSYEAAIRSWTSICDFILDSHFISFKIQNQPPLPSFELSPPMPLPSKLPTRPATTLVTAAAWAAPVFGFGWLRAAWAPDSSPPSSSSPLRISSQFLCWLTDRSLDKYYLSIDPTYSSPSVPSGMVSAQVASSAVIRCITVWYALEFSLSSRTPWSSKSE